MVFPVRLRSWCIGHGTAHVVLGEAGLGAHADGWRIRTIDLPSAGGRAGVLDDGQAVLGELELIDGPVLVVAHSCGGMPVSEPLPGRGMFAHRVPGTVPAQRR